MSKRPRENSFNRHTQTSSDDRYGVLSGTGPGLSLNENQLKAENKPGRNAPCSCGSKRKYKKCCGAPKKTLEERFASYDTVDEYPEIAGGPFSNDATRVEED